MAAELDTHTHNGEAFKTIDPAGKEDRTEFDEAGRRRKVIENYDNGNPGTGMDDQHVTVEFTYNADGKGGHDQGQERPYGRPDHDVRLRHRQGGITPAVYRNDLLPSRAVEAGLWAALRG